MLAFFQDVAKEAADAIKGSALSFAAFVEGVALFAAVIGLMLATK